MLRTAFAASPASGEFLLEQKRPADALKIANGTAYANFTFKVSDGTASSASARIACITAWPGADGSGRLPGSGPKAMSTLPNPPLQRKAPGSLRNPAPGSSDQLEASCSLRASMMPV